MSTIRPEDITINGRIYRSVREGSASILAPYHGSVPTTKAAKNNDEGHQAVFYNPIQQFNRDLSVLAILIHGEGAVLEKSERLKKKLELKNARKAKSRPNKQSTIKTTSNECNDSTTLKKRKAEADPEDTGPVRSEPSKKQKIDEFDTEEEELAVLELAALKQPLKDAEQPSNLDGTHERLVDAERTTDNSNVLSEPTTVGRGVPFTILDALSASGLRALRYAKEIPFATRIIANDLSPSAIESIELNIDHNNLNDIVHANVGDARAYMYGKIGDEQPRSGAAYIHRFDVIDLDPYGTAAPFFDAAIQSLQDGGLLCVTCTDAGVFASVGYLEKTYDLYGGLPLKGAHSHEGGLRLILHAIATCASRYGIAIEPLLSLSIDFYARVFVRIHKQQNQAKLLAGTTMLVYSCDFGCGSWTTQPLARNQAKEDKKGDTFFKYSFAQVSDVQPNCKHCGSRMHLGGPMWAGPLHNPFFVQRMLDRLPNLDRTTYGTVERLQGMLTLALEEDLTLAANNIATTTASASNGITETSPAKASTADHATETPHAKIIPRLPPSAVDTTPFFFIPNYLAKVLHTTTPSEDALRGAIRHLGYRVTRSHCKPGSFKTNAPWSVLWEIMREWVRTRSPVKEGKLRQGGPGWAILQKTRGTDSKRVADMREEMDKKLQSMRTAEDMRTVLESAMFRLDHPAQQTQAVENGGDEATHDNDISKRQIVFDERLGKEKARGKLVRYQINPRANWGPMNRASGST